MLLDNGAEANVVDVNNSTSLHLAAANGDVDTAVLLLEREAHVDAQDRVTIGFYFTQYIHLINIIKNYALRYMLWL